MSIILGFLFSEGLEENTGLTGPQGTCLQYEQRVLLQEKTMSGRYFVAVTTPISGSRKKNSLSS